MLPVQEQMLNAVELFYYSLKFEDSLFVFQLTSADDLRKIADDLQVVHSSHIRSAICCPHTDEIQQLFNSWREMGANYHYFRADTSVECLNEIRAAVGETSSTSTDLVIAVDFGENSQDSKILDEISFKAAELLWASKLLIFNSFSGLVVDGDFKSHPSSAEVAEFLESNSEINISQDRLSFLHQRQQELNLDVILLEAAGGTLFQEVFTHGGKGTLLSGDYPNVFRKAEALDVRDILFLMRPYMNSDSVLPMSEKQILDQVDSFYVFTVDSQIVAMAAFFDHQDCLELGKLCTLPRYQQKGRARTLVQKMLQVAAKKNKKYVFALSVDPLIWKFFIELGFEEVSREALPESWQKRYNLERKSKAFRFMLS